MMAMQDAEAAIDRACYFLSISSKYLNLEYFNLEYCNSERLNSERFNSERLTDDFGGCDRV